MLVRRVVRTVLIGRWVLLAAVTLTVYLTWIARLKGQSGGDWHLFVLDATAFSSPHPLHALSVARDLPTGPLTIVLCSLLRHLGSDQGWQGACVFMFCLAPLLLLVAEAAAKDFTSGLTDRLRATTLIGGCLVVVAWGDAAASTGHPDDVIALVGLVAVVLGCVQSRWVFSAVMLGLAAAFKPWGFYFLPLAAVSDPRRYRGPALALAVGILPWVPFVLTDRHSLDAGHFLVPIVPGSSLRAFGLEVYTKVAWLRPFQFLVVVALGALAVRGGHWILVLWLGFVLRINLEPGTFAYYGIGPVVGALVVDMMLPRRIVASRALLTWFLLYGVGDLVSFFGAGASALAVARIVARLALLAVVLGELFMLGRAATIDPPAAVSAAIP